MSNTTRQGCQAERVLISGKEIGIIDLERKVAYLSDADAFLREALGEMSGLEFDKARRAYMELIVELSGEFKVRVYEPQDIINSPANLQKYGRIILL